MTAEAFRTRGPHTRTATFLILAMMLGGCAGLPSSGPTARQVVRSERAAVNKIGLQIVEIDPMMVNAYGQNADAPAENSPLAALATGGRVDTIGAGDLLQIDIFETGTPLFSGGPTAPGTLAGDVFDPSARREGLPGIMVDEDGVISLPYVGRLTVAGLTSAEVEELIEKNLVGKSQNPQAVVRIRENVANTVYVMGEVRRPGRLPLSGARERLLDAVAAAGGTADPPEDMVVRFTRGGQSVEEVLSGIRIGTRADLVLLAGDRIELIKRARTYTVFGATHRVSQQPFGSNSVSLAEAVARVGGANDQLADPTAVFVFRYEPGQKPEDGEAPTIYRLNLMKPSHYFLAQRFPMRDKDVIYIANAAANQPSKLVQIINQLFSPLFLARQVTK